MILFISPGCSQCIPVKNFIRENDLKVDVINVVDQHSRDMAANLGVRSSPTLVDRADLIIGGPRCLEHLQWVVGEERMKNITRNGNDGEHYEN